MKHLQESDYLGCFPSGFRPKQGAEMTIAELMDNHSSDLDKSTSIPLFSMAFDTINYGLPFGSW